MNAIKLESNLFWAKDSGARYWMRIAKWWHQAGGHVTEPKCEKFIILASQILQECKNRRGANK